MMKRCTVVANALPSFTGRTPVSRVLAHVERRCFAAASTEQPMKVAFPGSPGSLSSIGAKEFFRGLNAELSGLGGFQQTFEAVASGEADYGVVPVENSVSGTINNSYKLLLQHDVSIAGDLGIHEKYCLCVKPGTDLASVRSITSHPQILDACSEFISRKLSSASDLVAAKTTCEAAMDVAKGAQSDVAAIATHEAAAIHGLKVLETDIGNDVFMETRYILIRRASDNSSRWSMPTHIPGTLSRRQSACYMLRNEPGALFKLLSCFALRGVNVLKVESRPFPPDQLAQIQSKGQGSVRLWDHMYYVDHEVPNEQTEDEAAQLWSNICEYTNWQRDFGTYGSLVSRVEKKSKTWDQVYENLTWG